MKIKIQRIHPEAVMPAYAYPGDAGLDLFAVEKVVIPAGENRAVATGLKMAIPAGYAGFIWDKSGLSLHHQLKTMAGVIDSNYRGEVKVVIMNLGKNAYEIEKGSKIAQIIIAPVLEAELEEGEVDDMTERGSRGFGSSG